MLSELSIENRIFAAARTEFDIALRETVKEMLFRQKTQCSVALKIKIEIQDKNESDIIPAISFKTSANIPDKLQSSGNLHADCVLRVNEDGVAINVLSEQTSMMDPPDN